MKAWKVTHKEFPRTELIYEAENRNQAKYISLSQAREAGYGMSYIKAKSTRAPEYDEKVGTGSSSGCLGWSDGQDNWGCLATKG